jgi:hypothetical protein
MTDEAERQVEISQLAKDAQVCGISNNNSLPKIVRAFIAKADTTKQHLNGEALKETCNSCKTSKEAVEQLMAASSQIVDIARQQLLAKQPQLIKPDGELYPEPRAEACWHDCYQFLRVIIYGVACNCTEITDEAGMAALRKLYNEMKVPTSAMIYLLNQMRGHTTRILEDNGHTSETLCLNMAFDNLIKALLQTDP